MHQPFTHPATHADFMLVASMAIQQNHGNPFQAALFGMSISPGKGYIVSGSFGLFTPDVVLDLDAGFNLVSITGTENWIQLLLEIAGSALIPFDNLVGKVNAYFALNVSAIAGPIFSVLNPSKPTVFVGHSLGGAVAEILAAYAFSTGLPVRGVFTLGAPKPGDFAFLGNFDNVRVTRLENIGDVVPSLPQRLPALAQLVTPIPVQSDWGSYAHPGAGITQDGAGDWENWHLEMSPTDIMATLLAQTLNLHYAETYYQWLKVGFTTLPNLVPFANGYEKPWKMIGLQTEPPPPGQEPGPGIPVPSTFTNKFDLFQLQGQSLVPLGTVLDPPPPSWSPSFIGVPRRNRGCKC